MGEGGTEEMVPQEHMIMRTDTSEGRHGVYPGNQLQPSSGAQSKAREEEKPVGVSFFDQTRTTVPQMRALTGLTGPVFAVKVAEVLQIGAKAAQVAQQKAAASGQADVVIEDASAVVYSTNRSLDITKPGADGHCDVRGLGRPGAQKSFYRAFRGGLAQAMKPVPEDEIEE